MRSSIVPLALLLVLLSPGPGPAQTAGAAELYGDAMTFQEFLDGARRRHDTWHGNYGRATPAEGLLASAREIPGSWRLLVVAEDWCGDSANTLPYVAKLAEELDNLDVRVVKSAEGREIMEAHPTPDGRVATPTMVMLDEGGALVGCLVEQPRVLQEWWLGEARKIEDEGARFARKYAWYDDDAGASIMTEIVQLMRAASEGSPVCRAGTPGAGR